MNERLRELAKQAGLAEAADVRGGYLYPQGMEKFAELIVKECAQFVEDEFDFMGDEIIVKEKMLKRFGVEE